MISLMPAYPYSSDPKEVGLAFMKNRMELYFVDVQLRGEYSQSIKR